jgi:hypothetical protein
MQDLITSLIENIKAKKGRVKLTVLQRYLRIKYRCFIDLDCLINRYTKRENNRIYNRGI